MSVKINPQEVLHYLNELGYYNITGKQLKEFIKDLKKLIKYDEKKKQCNRDQENVDPRQTNTYFDNYVENVNQYDDIENVAAEINQRRDRKHTEEHFNNLYAASTISSRAKSCEKKDSEQNLTSVKILKPKPSKPFSSSCTASEVTKLTVSNKSLSCSTNSRSLGYYGGIKSEPTQLAGTSRHSVAQKASSNIFETKPRTSFIRPRKPVIVSKSDPVNLYRQYQEEWNKQKIPGENKRFDLRWAIRERMLGDPDIMPRMSKEIISRKGSRI